MAKSDALYYYPSAHGVTDLAVEIVIEEAAAHAVAKQAKITFYYSGADKRRLVVTNVPDSYGDLRKELLMLAAPVGDFIMPRTAVDTFAGLKVTAETVARQLSGVPGATFVLLTGANPDEQASMKEYQVLLGQDGLAYEVKSLLKDGSSVAARVQNIKIGEQWHVAKMTTRVTTKSGPQWKVDRVEYGAIEGCTFPVRVTTRYVDAYGQPVKGQSPLTIRFENYRINQGAAAAQFAPPTPPPPEPKAE